LDENHSLDRSGGRTVFSRYASRNVWPQSIVLIPLKAFLELAVPLLKVACSQTELLHSWESPSLSFTIRVNDDRFEMAIDCERFGAENIPGLKQS
jgi:hypothetical protein